MASLKSIFSNYYSPTDSEFEKLWKTGGVSLDANALIDLFRISEGAASNVLAVLAAFGDRVWVSYQAALEFHIALPAALADESNGSGEILKRLDEAADLLFARPLILPAPVEKKFNETIVEIKREIESRRGRLRRNLGEGDLHRRLSEVLDGKIGPASDEKTKESLFAEGRLRYAKKQPPGFEDLKTKKDAEPERLYGDFLVWKQCLEHFAKKKTGLIFITGEKKSDWVRKAGGRVLGPHPDLVSEYANAVGGERFHLYDLANFLTYASPYVNVPVEKDAILEAEKLAKNESSHSSVLIAPRQSFGEMMRNLVRANENGTVSESFWKGFAAGNNLTSVVKMSPPDVRDPTDVSVNKAEEPDTE